MKPASANTCMGYTFRLAARVLEYKLIPDRTVHTTAFVTAVVAHWLEWLNGSTTRDRSD